MFEREAPKDRKSTRVLLFTDTLGDVNGVARFVRTAAAMARETGRDLRVMTSTRKAIEAATNIENVPTRMAVSIPRYPELSVVLPSRGAMLARAKAWAPDVIHVSTPGPVGWAGRWIARRLGVPLAGVYHTDFPAYVERLYGDDALVWVTRTAMEVFYRRFDLVLARSGASVPAVNALGVAASRVGVFPAGVRTGEFHPRFRVREAGDATVRVLYAGRVSVEKNLGLLAEAWNAAHAELALGGTRAELVVVGDGPHRTAMEREAVGARFLGYRHGEELAREYASADLFVFPSETDTLGQVVMEAQASGLPAIVSDVGGPASIVADGRTGLVLRRAGVRGWTRAIVGLARDGERRRAMGRAGHEAMQDRSFEASFEAFWALHEGLARARE